MKKEKDVVTIGLKNIQWLAILLVLLIVPCAIFASAATSGNGATSDDVFTWSWGTDNSKDNASGNFEGALSDTYTYQFTVSATPSKYKEASGCNGSTPAVDAASTTTSATIKNNSEYTFKVTSIDTSGANNATCSLTEGEILAPQSTFTMSIVASPNGANDTSPLKTSGSVTITFSIVENVEVVFWGAGGASYTYDEKVLAGEDSVYSVEMVVGSTLTLPADPEVTQGTFYGWRLSYDGSLHKSGDSVKITEGTSVYPVVITDGLEKPYTVGQDTYYFWTDAVCAAGSNGTVVINQNYTLPTTTAANGVAPTGSKFVSVNKESLNYSVPYGVTLLLPYEAGKTTVNGISHIFPYSNYVHETGGTAQLDPTKAWLTLTVPEGIDIVCNGCISVGGKLAAETHTYAGATLGTSDVGYFARMILDGTLTIGSTGVLSACGYITGNGTVDATATGAKIYEVFTIVDYRTGNYVVSAAGYSAGEVSIKFGVSINLGKVGIKPEDFPGKEYVFAFAQYSLRNIQTDITVGSGASLGGYTALYTSELLSGVVPARFNEALVKIFASDGLYVLDADTKATATLSYDAETFVSTENGVEKNRKWIGRNTITFHGDARFNEMELLISILGNDIKLKTSIATFNIPYHFELVVEEGSTFTLDKPMALMPGARFVVERNAKLVVNSKLFVLDGMYEHTNWSGAGFEIAEDTIEGAIGKYAYTAVQSGYPTHNDLQTAGFGVMGECIINGTMKIEKDGTVGGIIQTNGSGATIIVDPSVATNGSGNVYARQQFGLTGSWSVSKVGYTFQAHTAGATLHTLEAQIYHAGTGQLVALKPGFTYYSNSGAGYSDKDSFVQDVYYSSTAITSYETETIEYNPTIYGDWYTLRVHSDTNRNEGTEVSDEYRLDDYLWLNAFCYLDNAFTFAETHTITVTTYLSNGKTVSNTYLNGVSSANKDGVQVAVANGVVYLVKAIPAKEIPDSITFSISYNDGTKTYTSVKFTVSLEAYSATLTGNDKTLADKILAYGDAAKDYFGNKTLSGSGNPGTNNSNTLISPTDEKYLAQKLDEIGITTTGASIYFDEALRLSVGYQMSGATSATVGDYTIVQIGMLVQKLDNWNMANVLTTDPDKCSATAYIVYNTVPLKTEQNPNGIVVITPGGADNRPNNSFDGEAAADLKTFKASGEITFDLKAQDYKSGFAIRTYAVLQKGNQYYCVYGKQYGYGLEAYINAMYVQNATEAEDKSYNNLLEKTWALAAVAAG